MTSMDGYWTVDLPGLTYDGATRLLKWAKENQLGTGGSLVDPSSFLTLHLDRDTVEAWHRAVSQQVALNAPGPETSDSAEDLKGLADVFEEWLKSSSPAAPPHDRPKKKP